ncbi:MAG: phosphoribosylformylglycinamidine cyclo-ligase [Calditrichia bacterium]
MATYKESGVDVEKAEASLKKLKSLMEDTHNERVVKGIGSFGAMYDFTNLNMTKPVLVSSADGVGTKLLVAMMMNRHHTVGEDLVNHCVNDIAVTGATPLFFLDYYATGRLNPETYAGIIEGLARGCKNHNMPLIGGETAEMPDLYSEEDYDLAGTIVGVVDRDKIITGDKIRKGDVLIGIPSSGLHTNGYSLARKVLFNKYKADQYIDELGTTVGDELLKVHLSYLKIIQKSLEKFDIHGISHITGGGIYKNTARLLNDDLDLKIHWGKWEIPPIFNLIQKEGNVPDDDMRLSFNLGVGLIFIIREADAGDFISFLTQESITPIEVGEVI